MEKKERKKPKKYLSRTIDVAATGLNIRKLMRERNMSVAYVAECLGFRHPQSVYQWLNGGAIPSTDNLVYLSYLFEVSINEILVLTNESDPEEHDPERKADEGRVSIKKGDEDKYDQHDIEKEPRLADVLSKETMIEYWMPIGRSGTIIVCADSFDLRKRQEIRLRAYMNCFTDYQDTRRQI